MQIARWAFSAADGVLPLLSRLPFSLQRRVLEPLLNRALEQPLGDGEFDLLRGRWLCLNVTDLGLVWYVTVIAGRLTLSERAQADVSIAGTWRDFLLLASREEDPDTLFFRRRLLLEGDTELGLTLKNLIDSLDPESLPQWLWHTLHVTGRQLAQLNSKTAPAQS